MYSRSNISTSWPLASLKGRSVRMPSDGVETGMLCPTERIGVTMGPHTVEIYDPVSDTRRAFPVTVDMRDRSHRVRVD